MVWPLAADGEMFCLLSPSVLSATEKLLALHHTGKFRHPCNPDVISYNVPQLYFRELTGIIPQNQNNANTTIRNEYERPRILADTLDLLRLLGNEKLKIKGNQQRHKDA